MPDRHLEFWFEYGSTYTYLTVARIASVADGRKILVDWHPFLLMPILIEHGLEKGPFRHSIPYQRPSLYPPNTLSTARIGYLAQSEHWCADFTREVFRLHWTEGVIIGTDENIRRSLSFVGQDPDRIIAMAQSDDNKTGLRRQTEQAKALGVFGSPTFVVGTELFWGDDRLEDALDFAADEP